MDATTPVASGAAGGGDATVEGSSGGGDRPDGAGAAGAGAGTSGGERCWRIAMMAPATRATTPTATKRTATRERTGSSGSCGIGRTVDEDGTGSSTVLLEAASVCGAGPVRRFFHVVLPLVMPGILASAIFTFTHSYNEFTLTLLTYGPHTVTLPVRTYLAVGDGYWEITSAMAVLMVAPSLLILALVQRRARPERLVGGFKGA